jgi:hypothetical protein
MGIKTEVRDLHLNAYPEEEALLKPFLAGFDVLYFPQLSLIPTVRVAE